MIHCANVLLLGTQEYSSSKNSVEFENFAEMYNTELWSEGCIVRYYEESQSMPEMSQVSGVTISNDAIRLNAAAVVLYPIAAGKLYALNTAVTEHNV